MTIIKSVFIVWQVWSYHLKDISVRNDPILGLKDVYEANGFPKYTDNAVECLALDPMPIFHGKFNP